MKKIAFSIVTVLLMATGSFSQSYEGTIQFDKKKQLAIVSDFGFTPQAVENAFVKRMDQLGYKPKEEKGIFNKDKGFILFKNALLPDVSPERFDYIIKVERKTRKEKDESVFYLLLMKNDENVLGKMDPAALKKLRVYVNEMLPDIEAANLELQIAAQEEVVTKAEKKLKQLQDDKLNLEKKLAENATAQDETIKDIDAQKKNLEALKEKRKKN